ncbi:MAG: M3 family metallopeptidase [Alloprevotella sp.]
MKSNPFFDYPYTTPHGTFPFGLFDVACIEPALREGIRREAEAVERIASCPEAPTFANTIVALEHTGKLLERVTTIMYNLLSADTSEELEAVAEKMAPVLSDHHSSVMLHPGLFERVASVWRDFSEGRLRLEADEEMLLRNTYEGFERSGATLDEAGKVRFRELSAELSRLCLQFSQNCLKDTNAYELHLTKEEDLAGLPELQRRAAAEAAAEKGLEGWLFTLKAPSYVPFLQYADNRALRKEMFMAYNTIGTHPNENNNFEIARRIINLRGEKARLLGYKSYAAFALARRMAETPERVERLLKELLTAYASAARCDVEAVAALARELQGADFVLQPWDFAYFSNKLRQRDYAFDSDELRPYFPLEQVKKGVFGLAETLYGIRLHRNAAIPVYHPDVEAYEVTDADGTYLAVLYVDFYPRLSKQGGAWMTNYKEQWQEKDAQGHSRDSRPHVSLTTNFTKPSAGKPALLTLDEVETFLHEFGHCLHGIFSRTRFQSLSGTNVFWDFVELPSQIMENFSRECDFLRTFAFHYETGEPIPDGLIGKIQRSRHFNAAYACMRQLSFGLLDMAYYSLETALEEDIPAFEEKAMAAAQVLPHAPGTCMTTNFKHIISGGYAAGYYSYKWAEVLDADAFEEFRAHGLFSQSVADRFRRTILERGGTAHPAQLYRDFRGHDADIRALLRRDGIIE